MAISFYIFIGFLPTFTHAVVMVDRRKDGQDVFSHNSSVDCSLRKAESESSTLCRCLADFKTFGANDPPCTAFSKCGMFAEGVKLILNNVSHHDVAPKILKETCKIKTVSLWNIPSYRSNFGGWTDVTDFSLRYFDISNSDVVVRLPFPSWQGQLIKIILNCDNTCGVLKVEGKVTYPFIISTLNPERTRSACIADCGNKNDEKDDSMGIIISVVVVLAILVVVAIILVRVCRHKFPCWKYDPPVKQPKVNADDMSNRSTRDLENEDQLLHDRTNENEV